MMKLVVLSCLLAAASASAVFGVAPLAYSAPFAYAAPLAYAPHNYRGPLSLAPGQPANILAADGRPLDTLDVNLDRAAHYTAKAFDGAGIHLLKKRSVAFATPVVSRLAYSAPIAYSAALPYHAPLAYSAPIVRPYAYSAPIAHALY